MRDDWSFLQTVTELTLVVVKEDRSFQNSLNCNQRSQQTLVFSIFFLSEKAEKYSDCFKGRVADII